jgi:hypothetical protein
MILLIANDAITLILEKNPGLFNILLTGVVLPLSVLWLTNRNARKLKELEKKLELEYKAEDEIREQEKKVYASLSKILFDVQQLHVSLSGTCIDTGCIENGLKRFDTAVSKCHDDISNNMLSLSSPAINLIYECYNIIGRLKIELQELDKNKAYEMAHVAVYYSSQGLAETIIDIQELFVAQRVGLGIQFSKAQQEMMKYCCGSEPPEELRNRYDSLKAVIRQQELI